MKRISVWQPIIQKIRKKLSLWKGRVLSQSGRLALIKSTLSAMPLYYLSIFRMPKGVTNLINHHLRDFFWSGGTHSKKIHRVRWDFITRPKEFGGLGILDIEIQNKALLAKWLWRLHDETEALWVKIIRQKYAVSCIDNIFVSSSRHYSLVWKDISQVILANDAFNVILLNCISFEVGDGHRILF